MTIPSLPDPADWQAFEAARSISARTCLAGRQPPDTVSADSTGLRACVEDERSMLQVVLEEQSTSDSESHPDRPSSAGATEGSGRLARGGGPAHRPVCGGGDGPDRLSVAWTMAAYPVRRPPLARQVHRADGLRPLLSPSRRDYGNKAVIAAPAVKAEFPPSHRGQPVRHAADQPAPLRSPWRP